MPVSALFMNFDAATHERIRRFAERDHAAVAHHGRSLLLHHGRRTAKSIVLFHGLTASPAQFAHVARDLHDRGHNVFVPRLPRHGYGDRLTDALRTLRAEDLRALAVESVELASGLGESVAVAGFSLGGLLAAWCAQFLAVDRAALISPYLGIAWVPAATFPYVARALRRLPNAFVWWNPFIRERLMPGHGYPRYATHSVAEPYTLLRELYRNARDRAPKARRVAVVINASETTVNNRSALRLAKLWTDANVPVELSILRDLPRVHDIVEPLRYPDVAAAVYPKLLAAIDS